MVGWDRALPRTRTRATRSRPGYGKLCAMFLRDGLKSNCSLWISSQVNTPSFFLGGGGVLSSFCVFPNAIKIREAAQTKPWMTSLKLFRLQPGPWRMDTGPAKNRNKKQKVMCLCIKSIYAACGEARHVSVLQIYELISLLNECSRSRRRKRKVHTIPFCNFSISRPKFCL